jgi:uncharacterized membrane protein YdfJ with MMPL/SSD domain
VIALMVFFVYRSVLTTLLVLATVLIEMSAARGLGAFLGNAGVIGLSTYATNLLTLLVIAAGTDYAIFFVGRYQEARGTGEDREKAFCTMYHGTTHIVLGSGLTVGQLRHPVRHLRADRGRHRQRHGPGRAFDAAKNDDTFYLPPKVFNTPTSSVGSNCFSRPTARRPA